MKILKALNKEVIDLEISKISFLGLTAICFAFDLYQLFTSANQFLALLAVVSLTLGLVAFLKIINEYLALYILAYLIPIFCLVLSIIPEAQSIGINPADFELNAYATAGSALIPPIGTFIIVPLVKMASAGTKWLASKA
ncbi:hypothetical protein [Aquipseudomonas alcaligenes]|uniref:hypothetical protein n=1 Tax=Aquipseudomonas alcaligenes TaxID=43263 RepID=UPI001179C8D3|nr:hypothetical protein [Pseudomonas alcaligenes]